MFGGPKNQKNRFVSHNYVIQCLTKAKTELLPAQISPTLCDVLAIAQNTLLVSIARVNTKGVGATQCRPYILTFNNGSKLFLKLTPAFNQSSNRQRQADKMITNALGPEQSCPFILLTHSMIIEENDIKNEILLFPFVPGDNLYITHQYLFPDEFNQRQHFFSLGVTLAKIHIGCMVNKKSYNSFLESYSLPPVLVHDDWQSTNIMITPDHKAVIIDTEGTHVSTNAYRNIIETWELVGKEHTLMQSFLSGYTHAFPTKDQGNIFQSIIKVLIAHGIELPTSSSSSSLPETKLPQLKL